MARGPDGKGQAQGFSLKDELFNANTVGDLAREFAVLPGFDPDRFMEKAVPGLAPLGLLERLDWLADCLEDQLPSDFPAMAEALEAAMPPVLDPCKTDHDFGRFIHAVPGILAVRHGLDLHRDRALDLLEAATQRFSMEFYIRPFLNRWPEETLARLGEWVEHDNYHVRRLVSEGTRPRLPWATNIDLDPMVPLTFLDALHADPTRYVTRSVANLMNDLSKFDSDRVVKVLSGWQTAGQQSAKELDWMTRHALRTAVKRGEPAALRLLGFDPDAKFAVTASVLPNPVKIGEGFTLDIELSCSSDVAAMVDYRIQFHRPNGRDGEKVFKLKSAKLSASKPLKLSKFHKLKANASTFTLHPGPHTLVVQVNGVDRATVPFDLVD